MREELRSPHYYSDNNYRNSTPPSSSLVPYNAISWPDPVVCPKKSRETTTSNPTISIALTPAFPAHLFEMKRAHLPKFEGCDITEFNTLMMHFKDFIDEYPIPTCQQYLLLMYLTQGEAKEQVQGCRSYDYMAALEAVKWSLKDQYVDSQLQAEVLEVGSMAWDSWWHWQQSFEGLGMLPEYLCQLDSTSCHTGALLG